ncbi:hypothetical protein PsorP6_005744 [Peronosclerospora sorghi]|uniref:Uncharacterized protein n=1 Tax=Peronosclerospora sorghi TaxID=230839 RepID=A0ACC0W459_9STRA|nr:hypothetical protein PsorP6_005744 [Peronosclerospora sorghi]
MTNPEATLTPPLEVRKLKLQLFHCLQRRHCDAWKRYWGSFQLYLVAKLSLEEFHALAEELLGPDKRKRNCGKYLDLHNEFVVALLRTAYHGDAELQRGPQPHSTSKSQSLATLPVTSNTIGEDFEQQGNTLHGRKQQHSSVSLAADEAAVNKLQALSRDKSYDHDYTDHHSAQLLMDLYKHATPVDSSAIEITSRSTPSNSTNGFRSRVPMQDFSADSFDDGS